jgi:hypothetical protein
VSSCTDDSLTSLGDGMAFVISELSLGTRCGENDLRQNVGRTSRKDMRRASGLRLSALSVEDCGVRAEEDRLMIQAMMIGEENEAN